MNRLKPFTCDMRSAAWAFALLAATVAFTSWIVRPQVHRMRELASLTESERADLADRSASLEALARAEREVADLRVRTGDFADRIPDHPAMGGFLEDLARVVQKHRLQSEAVQPGDPLPAAETVALPIAVKVRGSFPAVFGLLQDLERMPRLTRVEHFAAKAEPDSPGTVSAEMTVRVFYRAAPPEGRPG